METEHAPRYIDSRRVQAAAVCDRLQNPKVAWDQGKEQRTEKRGEVIMATPIFQRGVSAGRHTRIIGAYLG